MESEMQKQGSSERQPEVAAHTPGPWKAEADKNVMRPQFLILGGGIHIASVPKQDHLGYSDEANAHLIASAPDLRNALIDAVAALATINLYPGHRSGHSMAAERKGRQALGELTHGTPAA